MNAWSGSEGPGGQTAKGGLGRGRAKSSAPGPNLSVTPAPVLRSSEGAGGRPGPTLSSPKRNSGFAQAGRRAPCRSIRECPPRFSSRHCEERRSRDAAIQRKAATGDEVRWIASPASAEANTKIGREHEAQPRRTRWSRVKRLEWPA